MLVLGTYRDVDVSWGHPLFRTLGELTRQHLYQRVLLRGLSRDEVGQIMEATGGITLPQELAVTVHQQTEGNPLFVREVVRLLAEEGLLAPERLRDLKDWDFRLPDGIREVIGRRLDRLSKDCNEVLTAASIIGREFNVGLLEQIFQQSQQRLLEVLEEALAAKIIDELPFSMGHYQFSHGLTQQTLAAEISTTRKARLHARIAQALEELYGADAPAHAAELAYHLAEAEAVAGAEKLVRYSHLAGESALAAYAYEEALSHFQQAFAAKEGHLTGKGVLQDAATEGGSDAETADLLFGLGRAQAAIYQIEESLANLGRAFKYSASARDAERVMAIASHLYPGVLTRRMTDIHRRALSLVPSESHDAGRLLAVCGLSFGTTGDYDGAKKPSPRPWPSPAVRSLLTWSFGHWSIWPKWTRSIFAGRRAWTIACKQLVYLASWMTLPRGYVVITAPGTRYFSSGNTERRNYTPMPCWPSRRSSVTGYGSSALTSWPTCCPT